MGNYSSASAPGNARTQQFTATLVAVGARALAARARTSGTPSARTFAQATARSSRGATSKPSAGKRVAPPFINIVEVDEHRADALASQQNLARLLEAVEVRLVERGRRRVPHELQRLAAPPVFLSWSFLVVAFSTSPRLSLCVALSSSFASMAYR